MSEAAFILFTLKSNFSKLENFIIFFKRPARLESFDIVLYKNLES